MDVAVPWRIRDVVLLLTLGFGTFFISLIGAQGLIRLQGTPVTVPAQAPPEMALAATDLVYVVLLSGVWFLVVRRYSIGWDALGLRLPARSTLPIIVVLFCALAAGSVAVAATLSAVLAAGGIAGRFVASAGLPSRGDPLFVVGVMGLVVLTPVVEEVLFRGVLYQVLRKHSGPVAATVGSAILFTALHLQPAVVLQFLLLGVILAVTFERTRSLYPAILMHAAYNATIVMLALHPV